MINRDEQIFMEQLYRQYFPILKYQILKITNDEGLIEDLIQDTFVRLIKHSQKILTMEDFAVTSYVYSTVNSVCIDYLRKKGNNNLHLEDLEDIFEEELVEISAEQRYMSIEIARDVRKAMDQLPKNDKDLLHYKYFMDYSLKEISQYTHIPYQNISSYLSRAKRKLVEILKKGK